MSNDEFKSTLWGAADKLRGSVAAATYKYPVLGLVFLKYVSDLFDAQAQVILKRLADPKAEYYIPDEDSRREIAAQFIQDKTFYDADNVFWVPPNAHFSALLAQAAAPDLAQRLNKALGEIEVEKSQPQGRAVPRVLSSGARTLQARRADAAAGQAQLRPRAPRQPRRLRRDVRILPGPVRPEGGRARRRVLHTQERGQPACGNPCPVHGGSIRTHPLARPPSGRAGLLFAISTLTQAP